MKATPYPAELGFKSGTSGTHTSRTLMLEELATILAHTQPGSSKDEIVRAIVDENALGKDTVSTRRATAQRLSELYALDTGVPIFRALQKLWPVDRNAQPTLALLSGLARDPLLRATAPAVLALRDGQNFDRSQTTEALKTYATGRLNDAILDKVVRNTASSWTQSGHLAGRTFKSRQRVKATPPATTLALLLGYLQGLRSVGLFHTLWCQVLDSSPEALAVLASRASMSGLLRFRQSGDVIEISFPDLLTQAEIERATHGQD